MKPSQRYRAMAHNRGRTGPERTLASALWRQGVRYFTHEGYKSVKGTRLPGNPDMVLPGKRMVIFVDGCFWHGCPQCGKHEGLTEESWVNKIAGNVERDGRVTAELEDRRLDGASHPRARHQHEVGTLRNCQPTGLPDSGSTHRQRDSRLRVGRQARIPNGPSPPFLFSPGPG